MTDPRYERRETANDPKIRDAIRFSSGRRRNLCASTDIDYDAEAKRRFDENYDAIFRKPQPTDQQGTSDQNA